MTQLSFRHIFCVALIATSSAKAAVDDIDTSTPADSTTPLWHLDVSAERTHQDFAHASADLDTYTFSPSVQIGNFEFSLSAPYQFVKGSYFVNRFQPSAAYFCQQLADLSNLEILALIKAGRITLKQAAFCQANAQLMNRSGDKESEGWSDATVSARYLFGNDDWSGHLALIGKWDNGSTQQGYGTGSRDASGELSLTRQWTYGSITATGGHTWTGETGTKVEYQNYSYGSLHCALRPTETLTVGVQWTTQQSSSATGDTLEYPGYYIEFRPADALSLRAFSNDYRGEPGYPEKEYGGSVTLSF